MDDELQRVANLMLDPLDIVEVIVVTSEINNRTDMEYFI